MNGELGATDVKPDQMQLVNPLLILLFIPLYDVALYPLLSKLGIRRPLQKLTLGGIFGGIAFLCSGIVELQLEKTYPILPVAGECQLRIYNTYPCDYSFATNIPDLKSFDIKSMEVFQDRYIPLEKATDFTYTMTPKGSSANQCDTLQGTLNLKPGMAISYYGKSKTSLQGIEDDPNKSRTGDPVLRILVNTETFKKVIVNDVNNNYHERHNSNSTDTDRVVVLASTYDITVGTYKIESIPLKQGGVSTILVRDSSYSLFELSPPNSLHIFWQIPQYVILTLGEVMFSVTGLQFSYSQAPESMKSVIQACWQLTVAFGNVIDIIVVGAKFFDSQVSAK